MGKEIDELIAWLDQISEFSLPSYKDLPSIDLYMEQVLSYINGELEPFADDPKKGLTSFMVNNYVKAKLISMPDKKKYSKEQIGYLMAITLMKQTMSLEQMKTMLSLDKLAATDLRRLYEFYRTIQTRAINEKADAIGNMVDRVNEDYKKVKEYDPEKAEEFLTGRLGLIAMKLAAQAEVAKLISDRLIVALDNRLLSEQELKAKQAKANNEKQAKRKKEIEKQIQKNKKGGKQ